MSSPAEVQLAGVRALFPDASLTPLSSGGHELHLPSVSLPAGWSLSATGMWIVAPAGYPMVRPDCFFADEGLRLANGGEPTNSAIQIHEGSSADHISWVRKRQLDIVRWSGCAVASAIPLTETLH